MKYASKKLLYNNNNISDEDISVCVDAFIKYLQDELEVSIQ